MSTREQRLDYLLGRGSPDTMRLVQDELTGEPDGDTAQFLDRYRHRASAADRVDWPVLLARIPAGPDLLPARPLSPAGVVPPWAALLWESAGAAARGIFPLVDSPVQGAIPSHAGTRGIGSSQGSPASAGLLVRRVEVLPAECLWLAGSPAPFGGRSALVEVRWARGTLSVHLDGWLSPREDCQVSVVWCSAAGEVRAALEALELMPKDRQEPHPGDVLLVRHARQPAPPWEVLFGLRF